MGVQDLQFLRSPTVACDVILTTTEFCPDVAVAVASAQGSGIMREGGGGRQSSSFGINQRGRG